VIFDLKLLAQGLEYKESGEINMRSFLINKNLCFYYWLRRRVGKRNALLMAMNIEKMILIFGREVIPYRP
jgi:hypothetical protein